MIGSHHGRCALTLQPLLVLRSILLHGHLIHLLHALVPARARARQRA